MWNLPNILTLSRIPMMFVIVGLMYADRAFAGWTGAATGAFGLFIAAAISDWLDGAIARRRGTVSNFGKFMDALTDKILVIGILVALVRHDEDLPITFVLLTIGREFMVSGMRMVVATKGIVVAADSGGKDYHPDDRHRLPPRRANAGKRFRALDRLAYARPFRVGA